MPIQLFRRKRTCKQGPNTCEERISSVARHEGIRLVENRRNVIIGSDAFIPTISNYSVPLWFHETSPHDVQAEHTPHASMALSSNVVELQRGPGSVHDGIVRPRNCVGVVSSRRHNRAAPMLSVARRHSAMTDFSLMPHARRRALLPGRKVRSRARAPAIPFWCKP